MYAAMLEELDTDAGRVAAVAESYAQAAGWLAGIAAALLVVYLNRHPTEDRDARSDFVYKGKEIGPRHVVRAL